ncbi:MAG: N-formylglutamate deformylase [Marivirga sp.]|nr:N-formylglutamate deformylase [Marivirga sp.]
MNSFKICLPEGSRVPLLLSVPHCGTHFPEDLIDQYQPNQVQSPDDTDWFVDRLYDFAPSMGITMITATYSRWVIDLNRDPANKPLYSDGRIITGLCPVTNFLGESLYRDHRQQVVASDVDLRKEKYYDPYHQKLTDLLKDLKKEFGKVLLWDCHSIRQYVKTIYNENIPDLILGDVDGVSASPQIIELAFNGLKSSPYSVSHNFPFKGGFITRHYGKPLESQQVLQLEMTKINYMDDTETQYDTDRAEKMRALLQKVFSSLLESFGKKA